MKLTKNIQKAIIKAAVLHKDQERKEGDVPFIVHPYSVAMIVSNYTDDEDVIIGALLHDVLEDVPNYYESDMIRDFGEKITEIVKGVSEENDPNNENKDEKESWKDRKNNYVERLKTDSQESLMVCAADKIHNINSMIEAYKERGLSAFNKFNSSIEQRMEFHKNVFKVLKERLKSEIVFELEVQLKKGEEIFKSN